MDGRWGQQIMWSSVYVVCMNGMVRPDWTFTVYTKHNKREDIVFKRPGIGISPIDIKKILGKRLLKDKKKNKLIFIKDLEKK